MHMREKERERPSKGLYCLDDGGAMAGTEPLEIRAKTVLWLDFKSALKFGKMGKAIEEDQRSESNPKIYTSV